ncbi:MAG: Hint domain-containing protein [Dinoroseobacter sp.]|nr:Hint domain-containing protein [Dinoroseobacter sp.]MDJ0992001.1 Hint domain-containing protein [Dinoroseobacter sp.]
MTVMTRLDTGAAPPRDTHLTGLVSGANVRTPCGERRVENLRPGDLIVTRSDGLQALRHVIRITLSHEDLRKNPSLAPVRLMPRALGPMMPARPVALAPGHLVRVPAYLLAEDARDATLKVAATELLDNFENAFVDMGGDALSSGVTYHSLVFDTPQIFAVNGILVDSYAPDEESLGTLDVDTQSALRRLFPELDEERPAAFH